MAFKDFHDTRYKDARRLLIGSVAGVALTAGGLTALLWFSEPQTTEPAKVVVRAPPEPEPERCLRLQLAERLQLQLLRSSRKRR